mmetsp:Transcript_16347/g.35493  ORF Transcript_16347/g.35493 Transcript_16347/m.35493 type:complete len:446 (+) Transcript_16347:177-1514(+)
MGDAVTAQAASQLVEKVRKSGGVVELQDGTRISTAPLEHALPSSGAVGVTPIALSSHFNSNNDSSTAVNSSSQTSPLTTATTEHTTLNLDAIIDDANLRPEADRMVEMQQQQHRQAMAAARAMNHMPSSARVGGALRRIGSSASITGAELDLNSSRSFAAGGTKSPRVTSTPLSRGSSRTGTPRVGGMNGGSSSSSMSTNVWTEFVFVDARNDASAVFLCGDWNQWSRISLTRELTGCWSVITPVPLGYHEYCFELDGKFCVSSKHPTNSDGTCNWRNIYGPDRPDKSPAATRSGWWWTPRTDAFARDLAHALRVLWEATVSTSGAREDGEDPPLSAAAMPGSASKRSYRYHHQNHAANGAGARGVAADMAALSRDAHGSGAGTYRPPMEVDDETFDYSPRSPASRMGNSAGSPRVTRGISQPLRYFSAAILAYLALYYLATIFL